MWRQHLARMGAAVHPHLDRTMIASKGCYGIVSQDRFTEGSLLAVVPFWCCISPHVALTSPWGEVLDRICNSVSTLDGAVRVEYSRESLLTLSLLALAMHSESPVKGYLNFIEAECQKFGEMPQHALGEEDAKKLDAIISINEGLLTDHHRSMNANGTSVPLPVLLRSHRLCESRCVDISDNDSILGGPSLVPFVDLINHDNQPNNIVAYVDSPSGLLKDGFNDWYRCITEASTPFLIVVRAVTDIDVGQELTYQYIDAVLDPQLFSNSLYWAARFHFVPQCQ